MIKVKSLDFKINDLKILKDINIDIKKSNFIGIIGENGSGKSTILKNIYRMYSPKQNSIFLDGEDINSYTSKELAKKISVLSQSQRVTFDFSVKEIVEMGLYAKTSLFASKNYEKKIDEALSLVGLLDYKDKSFLTLSGGEIQRVFIARALAQESEILILDEPTNHLDVRYQYQIMDLVKSFSKTVVSVIHDINIASRYCDHIYAIKNGEIIYSGTPEEVLTSDNIKEIFQIETQVVDHPKTGKPLIVYM
nr:ABC transporter ATP-binding protein [uncultured Cetobacterium sp.]